MNDYAPAWAKNVRPEEWRERILRLPKRLRGSVAAIVWWDVFGNRPYNQRWTHLDDLVGNAGHIGLCSLRRGLEAVGYPAAKAAGRCRPTVEVRK